MELRLQQFLVRQLRFVFSDDARRQAPTEGKLNYFVILCCAEEYPDAGLFMRLPNVSVECFQIEVELSKVLGFEAAHFEFDRYQAVQPAMKEEQI